MLPRCLTRKRAFVLVGSLFLVTGVTSISDVKHKDLSHKLPKDEEVS